MRNILTIAAIIVTYFPEKDCLFKLVTVLSGQVDQIILVDNTPGSQKNKFSAFFSEFKNLKIFELKQNKGIAFAQNLGLKFCLNSNFDFAMLCDQDTIFPQNYVARMLCSLDGIQNKDAIAALVPSVLNVNQLKKSTTNCAEAKKEVFEVESGMASGKIINLRLINKIGLMKDSLFMDWVDYEWSWRARAKGYKILRNKAVVIEHSLGDFSKNIGFREVGLRNHIRHYYITRNAIFLALRCESITFKKRLILFFKSLKYIVGYTILSEKHLTNLSFTFLGFLHGFVGKMGAKKDLRS
jgi:rhamnosyltransferase